MYLWSYSHNILYTVKLIPTILISMLKNLGNCIKSMIKLVFLFLKGDILSKNLKLKSKSKIK